MKLIKKIINNFSIKQKLILLSMVTCTIATLVNFVFSIIFNLVAERNDLVDESKLITKIFSEELSTDVYHKNKSFILNSLSTLKKRQAVIQTCVYFEDQKNDYVEFINDSKRSRSCKDIPLTKNKVLFRNNEVAGEHIVISYDIFEHNNKVGSIVMLSNMDRINERLKQRIVTISILFIIILLISYVISKFLQKTISTPILHLADVSHMVQEGDYSVRAAHYSNDEIGMLTKAFNNMLDEIEYAKQHLEEKVVERTRDLEELMKIKGQFLSNMSHEIRTPIHGILNYVDFLYHDWDKLTTEARYDFVSKLYNNSMRLLSLINNLLDLSKIDAGKMEFFMQKYDIVPMIKDIINECEALLHNKNLVIELDYDKSLNYQAFFDQERIIQVLRNLLSNAIKFTPHGKIIIALELTKFKKYNATTVQAIKVSISDEGVGIPEDELEYIFDKFNQSAKTKTGAGGTGLGLTISKDIILAHSGVIWAENNLNKPGSTFTFIIPVSHYRSNKIRLKNA